MLVFGVLCIVIGLFMYFSGHSMNTGTDYYESFLETGNSDPGGPLMVIGALVIMTGIVLVILGFVKYYFDKEKNTDDACEEEDNIEKNCPKCGKTVDYYAKYCNECGFDFSSVQINICVYCGKQIPTESKFCLACGKADPFEKNDAKICPNCKASLPPESEFCMECGTKL